jgi:DNA-binding MarR family transcriptional regulator
MAKTDLDIINRFFNNLEITLKTYRKFLNNELKKIKISFDQYQVLFEISNKKNLNQIIIGQNLGKDNASITRILYLLNKKGFINLKKSEINRRKNDLELTNEGLSIIDKSNKIIENLNLLIEKNVNLNRIKKSNKELKKILKFFKNYIH